MDKVTTTIAPHFPGGFVTPQQLIQLAVTAERHGGRLKITGSSILVSGVPAEAKDTILAELGMTNQTFSAPSVRPVALCVGKPGCPRAQQDSTVLGLALDKEFYGQPTPGKLTMGVSGCPNCCAEVLVKDIGLFGLPGGYTLTIGGSAGRQARAGTVVARSLPEHQIIPIITAIIDYYRTHARSKERLGQLLDRTGLTACITQTIPAEYQSCQD